MNLETLRETKNAVIGNPTAKLALAQDEAFVETLVMYLNEPDIAHDSPSDIRLEAANVISSLSYGSQDALKSLVKAGAPQALLLALSHLQPSDPVILRIALTRAIRTLAIAVADVSGPQLWGLRPENLEMQNEANITLDYIFHVDSLDIYMPLLIDTSPEICASVAQMIAFAVRTQTHQDAVAEWIPPADRVREVKGRRGWEKPNMFVMQSPARSGWVSKTLVAHLESRNGKLQEAALSALAALAKENSSISAALCRGPLNGALPSPLSTILSLSKSRSVDIQLAACLCATRVVRANQAGHTSAALTILHVLNQIFSSPMDPPEAKAKACFILYYLVTDDHEFCRNAFQHGSLGKLSTLVTSITPLRGTEWDREESESISSLREAALMAIATLCLFENDIRREVTEKLNLVPVIHAGLSDGHVGVRYAACQCVRVLSRAVAVIRTNIVDSGLGLSVFALFNKEDEDRRVTSVALAAVCNLVNDFSPLRPVLLEEGLIPRIVQLISSGYTDLQTGALWAIKNLLRKSSTETKCLVMDHLGWRDLANLLLDTHTNIQAQAWNILCNLVENETGVEMVLRQLGPDVLLESFLTALGSSDEDVVVHATRTLANLANGQTAQKDIILSNRQILGCLRSCLSDFKTEIRRPAVTCVLELARADARKASRDFGEIGVTSTLRRISEHTPTVNVNPRGPIACVGDDMEMVEQARQALHLIESSGTEFELAS